MGTLTLSNNIASNIVNILWILGLGALVAPIAMQGRRHLADLAFLGAASVALAVMIWTDGAVGRADGIILASMFAAYLAYSASVIKSADAPDARAKHNGRIGLALASVAAGIAMLYFGSDGFIGALESVISNYGISQTLAGILIVAPGTSVPELLVTIFAALKGRPQIAVGNIIGSNFVNITLVTAAGAILTDLPASRHIMNFDIWVMLGATLLLGFNLLYNRRLSRLIGAIYLLLLAAYLCAAVMAAG
jgi:cation:H+ antiporter